MLKQTLHIVTGLITLFASSAFAHDIITTNLTYSRDISRVFARRCVECHGSESSIPLTNYEKFVPGRLILRNKS